jgi:formylglycine-generating enzyme required for sulfatase activity
MIINHYWDFVLVVNAVQHDNSDSKQFSVQVLESPTGESKTPEFVETSEFLKSRPSKLRKLENRGLDEKDIHDLGKQFADFLLPEAVRNLFLNSINRLQPNEGLRLRLFLEPSLASIPWEYLYVHELTEAKNNTGFCGLNPKISIVRHEPLSVGVKLDTTPKNRRLLVALASPEDEEILHLDKERENIDRALQDLPGIEPVYVQDATAQKLLDELIAGTDIFHFSGHGKFKTSVLDESAGYILLLGEDGKSAPMPAESLAVNLQSRGVQLVFLGACETGRRDEQNAWSGVVTNLMAAGIPAAIAMQYKIWDKSVIAFSRTFYKALAAGLPLEQAVSSGRIAVFNLCDSLQDKQYWRDWGVPVLYSRVRGNFVLPTITNENQRKMLLDKVLQEIFPQLNPQPTNNSEKKSSLTESDKHQAIANWHKHVESTWNMNIGKVDDDTGKREFIEGQQISFLPKRGKEALKCLHKKSGEWEPIERNKLLEQMQPDYNGESLRQIVVTGEGGIGKTANLRWFWHKLSNPDKDHLAFYYNVAALPTEEPTIEPFLNFLAKELRKQNKLQGNQLALVEDAEELIKSTARSGKLFLIVDALDQVNSSESISLDKLDKFLTEYPQCRVVLGGRPYAILDTSKNYRDPSFLDLENEHWQFIQIDRLSEEENQRALLGKQKNKLDFIREDCRQLMSIPRVLLLLTDIDEKDLPLLRTYSDFYWKALTKLIDEGWEALDCTKLNRLNPEWGHDERTCYVHTLFGAIAYTMTHKNWFDTAYSKKDNFKRTVVKLIQGVEDYKTRNVEEDLNYLPALDTIIEHPSYDGKPANTLTSVGWQNRTYQDFYTAYWLVNYADEDQKKSFGTWVFFPEDKKLDKYYDINQFVAEMPEEACHNTITWIQVASSCYKPKQPRRPSEMLYRSWTRMNKLAGKPKDKSGKLKDNWWDVSYETLINQRRNSDTQDEVFPEAQHILDEFHQEFQQILNQEQEKNATGTATEFIKKENWKIIPTGTFKMGVPESDQGFPAKLISFWNQQIEDASKLKQKYPGEAEHSGDNKSPLYMAIKEIAERCMKQEWYADVQGEKYREEEVEWLTETFLKLTKEEAFEKLEQQWRTRDETPVEDSQEVQSFEIHAFPILNKTFRLFYPDHGKAQKKYLAASQIPAPDHPVTYVSWYDCWAFCQWVRWQDPDTKKQYQCRLPHEPEWEFAAKGYQDGNFPLDQRYWWGNQFYDHEDSPEPEDISKPEAHALGGRGKTRSPREATPNPFGLHDILGNVWEWMANPYNTANQPNDDDNQPVLKVGYSRYWPSNEQPPDINCWRAMRGGLWYFLDLLSTCTQRFKLQCNDRDYKMGFRVIREELAPNQDD